MSYAPRTSMTGQIQGFTLIELMIAVAIIAIIAAIAYPSYINSVVKTKRAAAEGCISEYANYMERFYTTNLNYKFKSDKVTANPAVGDPVGLTLDCASVTNSGADYKFAITATAPSETPPNTYTITATPTGAQATRDTKCGAVSVNQLGTRAISGSGTVADCW